MLFSFEKLSVLPDQNSDLSVFFPSAFLSPQSLPPHPTVNDDDIFSYGIDDSLLLTEDDYQTISPPAEYAEDSPTRKQPNTGRIPSSRLKINIFFFFIIKKYLSSTDTKATSDPIRILRLSPLCNHRNMTTQRTTHTLHPHPEPLPPPATTSTVTNPCPIYTPKSVVIHRTAKR